MATLTASEARINLYRLIDEVASSHEPVQITGKRNNRRAAVRSRLGISARNPVPAWNTGDA